MKTPTGFAYYDTKGIQGGDTAALTGTLEIDPSCVYVATSNGKVVPIFPRQDTSRSDDHLVMHDQEFADGAQVTFTGGEQLSKPADAVVPESCPGDSYWIVAPG